jgi:RimJ/RimL family protein N-acetyltransferase
VPASPPPSGLAGITLRPLVAADVPEWFAYLSVPEVIEHTSWDLHGPQTLMALVREYESADPRSALRFAIVDERRAALAGTIGLHSISNADRRGEIAYDLAPRYWGRGIATAVCAAVTRWSFATLALQRVQATVLVSNTRSERVLERCGFACEGLLRGYRRVRGRPGDFKMFARLAGEPPLA